MILLEGCFPTNPHSGNILVRAAHGRCQTVLTDFSQVQEISRESKRSCARIVVALANEKNVALKRELERAGIVIDKCSRRFHAVAGRILFDSKMDIMRTFRKCGLSPERPEEFR